MYQILLNLNHGLKKKGISFTDDASLIKNDEVLNLLKNEIISSTTLMKSYERPSRFMLLSELFSQENQMLTPKMSLRRNNVLAVYKNLVDGMYSQKLGVDCSVKGGASD